MLQGRPGNEATVDEVALTFLGCLMSILLSLIVCCMVWTLSCTAGSKKRTNPNPRDFPVTWSFFTWTWMAVHAGNFLIHKGMCAGWIIFLQLEAGSWNSKINTHRHRSYSITCMSSAIPQLPWPPQTAQSIVWVLHHWQTTAVLEWSCLHDSGHAPVYTCTYTIQCPNVRKYTLTNLVKMCKNATKILLHCWHGYIHTCVKLKVIQVVQL